ncbi:hypothetical protein T03_1763 [Trichinella britovi]|uniref:Uncharacterized protein n=1 Tax=Trichinella britovi TaxID=45882 RepID=A0A0V1D4I0_TRIBR|nr:hypothetical protein T03_1763 [Trichinella britovi]
MYYANFPLWGFFDFNHRVALRQQPTPLLLSVITRSCAIYIFSNLFNNQDKLANSIEITFTIVVQCKPSEKKEPFKQRERRTISQWDEFEACFSLENSRSEEKYQYSRMNRLVWKYPVRLNIISPL